MDNEATNDSNISELVICMRWIDGDLVAHDEFIGLKHMPCTNADFMVTEIKVILLPINLKLTKCRRQYYDGCSTINGVAVQIKKE